MYFLLSLMPLFPPSLRNWHCCHYIWYRRCCPFCRCSRASLYKRRRR